MNLLLHGIGTADGPSLVDVRDALISDPGPRWSVVLSNLPAPEVIARQIVEDLTAALAEFEAVAASLEAVQGMA